jgi:hypothetical protein
MEGNGNCKIRDLALVAALQYKGRLPTAVQTEHERGRDSVVFIFPLDQEVKGIMGDYRYNRLQVDPRTFIVFYRTIKRQVQKIKYGGPEPQKSQEVQNAVKSTSIAEDRGQGGQRG